MMIVLLVGMLAMKLPTKKEDGTSHCLRASCKESEQISTLGTDVLALNKGTKKLEDQVVEQGKKTSELQDKVLDLGLKSSELQQEVIKVQEEIVALEAKLIDLKENLSILKSFTPETKVTIPSGKCSWIQVMVYVTGDRKKYKLSTFNWWVLYLNGKPVYGGTGYAGSSNMAATGFTCERYGDCSHQVTRVFLLPNTSKGGSLELKRAYNTRRYYGTSRITVMCAP